MKLRVCYWREIKYWRRRSNGNKTKEKVVNVVASTNNNDNNINNTNKMNGKSDSLNNEKYRPIIEVMTKVRLPNYFIKLLLSIKTSNDKKRNYNTNKYNKEDRMMYIPWKKIVLMVMMMIMEITHTISIYIYQ